MSGSLHEETKYAPLTEPSASTEPLFDEKDTEELKEAILETAYFDASSMAPLSASSATPWEIARREAWEEIGLPQDDSKIPKPFRIEQLCQLPFSLAKTALAVRPCVAFLHSDDTSGSPSGNVGESMIPRLDAKEVAAVFSAPFHNFLRKED
ncbi:hypothetical protein DH86_00000087, partial [Scytalidium sp. 3C]